MLKLLFLFSIFKKFGPSLSAERDSMLNPIIQWTIQHCPEYSMGHPSLHKRIGYIYWAGSWSYILISGGFNSH